MDAADAAEEGAQESGAPHDRPQTRKELDEIKKNFANKLQMAFHYHQDSMLPLEFKAMYWAAQPLLNEYENTLDIHKAGQEFNSFSLFVVEAGCFFF